MLYILAAILILVPVILLKLKLDDDLYRFLKVVLFKSDTIKKIKRKVVVVFSMLYAAIAMMIIFSFSPKDEPSSNLQQPVVVVAEQEKENSSSEAPEPAKPIKNTEQNVEFASLMLDMDSYISENSMPVSGNLSSRDPETLRSIRTAYVALVDNRIETFQARFNELDAATDSERSVFIGKLEIIKSDKDRNLTDIGKLIESKSAFSGLLFNYFVFESKQECLDVVANGKVSSWVGLDCDSSNQFAFIFSKTLDKETSSIIRLKTNLLSCELGKCLTTERKTVKKGFVSANKSYTEIQDIFGSELVTVLSTEKDLKSQIKERKIAPATQDKTDLTPTEQSSEHQNTNYKPDINTQNSVKWLSFNTKNNKSTNINMVVFREFTECDQFKDRLSIKIQKEIDCGSSKNIKKIKINGEIHNVSGFAYVYKRKSLEHIESYPIFKSESGNYVYPNGTTADETGLHLGAVPKDIESKFMSKN